MAEAGTGAAGAPAEQRALADNRANWDERAEVHVSSDGYDVETLIADPAAVGGIVREDLAVLTPHLPGGTVEGLSLLHLQCHIGTDTLGWWRLGARPVWGLDFSPNSLAHARDIASRAGADITFVEGDARFASSVIDRRFDVVVTSVGTIVWLPELESWARSIADLLEPGGVFAIRDDHPFLGALDYEGWTVTGSYLSGGGEEVYEADTTYTMSSDDEREGKGRITHTTNHEWRHDLSEIIMSLIHAGLRIESFEEYPTMDWKGLDDLVETSEGFVVPEGGLRIPLSYSIVARKPAE